MERSWRPFLCFLFGFGLHEEVMTTFSRLPCRFSASWSGHGDLFFASFSILGFMKPSWRPFPGFPSVFGLHEAVMTTFFQLPFRFWAS